MQIPNTWWFGLAETFGETSSVFLWTEGEGCMTFNCIFTMNHNSNYDANTTKQLACWSEKTDQWNKPPRMSLFLDIIYFELHSNKQDLNYKNRDLLRSHENRVWWGIHFRLQRADRGTATRIYIGCKRVSIWWLCLGSQANSIKAFCWKRKDETKDESLRRPSFYRLFW